MNFRIIFIYIILGFITTGFTSEIDFSKIDNWSPADSIEVYDSSDLWEYINGAADLFISYGFENLYSCVLSKDDIEVVLDVYSMGTRLNAFGMYKTERGKQKDLLNIGVEAVITSPHQSLMLKDIYYIKLNVYEGELTEESNKKLLHSIAGILPGSNEFPSEFDLLPTENKVEYSEHFTKESYLGLSELKNCIFADYKVNDKDFEYFVIIPESEETYKDIWHKFSEKWKMVDSEPSPILYKKIPYSGIVGIIKTYKGFLGVTNCNTISDLTERLTSNL